MKQIGQMGQGGNAARRRSFLPPARPAAMSALHEILLQKSKVASVRIFGETLKREPIDDSYNLSRATEVAYEFSVRR
jgi:hypothetical protein